MEQMRRWLAIRKRDETPKPITCNLAALKVAHFVGQLNAIKVTNGFALLVALVPLFTSQTVLAPLTARRVAPSSIFPTGTPNPTDTSYILWTLSSCQSTKSEPACSDDAPVLLITVGETVGSPLSGCMRMVPRADTSSGAA